MPSSPSLSFFAMKEVTKTCQLHPFCVRCSSCCSSSPYPHSPSLSSPATNSFLFVDPGNKWPRFSAFFPPSFRTSFLLLPITFLCPEAFHHVPMALSSLFHFLHTCLTTVLPSYFFLLLVFVDLLPLSVLHDRLERRFHVINDPGVADDWRLVNFIASRPICLFIGLRLAEEKSRSLTLFRTLSVKDAQNPNLAAMNRRTQERAARNSQMRKTSSFIPFLLPYHPARCFALSETVSTGI